MVITDKRTCAEAHAYCYTSSLSKDTDSHSLFSVLRTKQICIYFFNYIHSPVRNLPQLPHLLHVLNCFLFPIISAYDSFALYSLYNKCNTPIKNNLFTLFSSLCIYNHRIYYKYLFLVYHHGISKRHTVSVNMTLQIDSYYVLVATI